MTRKLVLASNNPGKLREFSALLAPLGYEVIPQHALGIPEAEEPHVTFVENALAKARHAAKAAGLPALADDSGLVVPALDGAPGVYSARYGGEPKSDARNNQHLLDALARLDTAGRPLARAAHYVCVLVFVRSADDPQPLIAEGEWHGEIASSARGSAGFGYDPYFLVPAQGMTVAELPPDLKNSLSHRGRATRALIGRLRAAGEVEDRRES